MAKKPSITVKVKFATGSIGSPMFGRVTFNPDKNIIGPESGERLLLIHKLSESADEVEQAQVDKDTRKLVKLLNKYRVFRTGALDLFTETTADKMASKMVRDWVGRG